LGIFSAPLSVLSRLPIAHVKNKLDGQQRWKQTLQAANDEACVVAWPSRQADSPIDTQGYKKAFPDTVIEYSGARSGKTKPGDRDVFSDTEKEVERSRVKTKNSKRVFGR